MTKSRIFLYLCFSFIGGIFWSSFFYPLNFKGFLIFGIILIIVFWRNKKIMVAGFCVLMFALGIFRYDSIILDYESFPRQNSDKVILKGAVIKEPEVRLNNTKLTVRVENFQETRSETRILIATNRYPEYQYGDLLKIEGRLDEPKIFPDFNYKGYLAKDGINYIMYNPQIVLIKHDVFCDKKVAEKNFQFLVSNFQCYKYKLYKTLLNIKNKLKENTDKFISSPQSAILNGIILGDTGEFSDDLKNKLNITGTRHITAVSGMNVTIIGEILFFTLIAIGFWRRQAFFLSIIILVLFVLMIGAPASAVRAGIMGGLLIFSQIFSRISNSSRTVIFAGAVMLAQNPLLLKFDAGFQLSFAAVFGIIYLKPVFDRWFSKLPKIFGFRDILAMTLSAQAGVFPILVYNFGQISIISPFVNILIVSLIPLVTVAGFLATSVGMIWQTLGQILSWPVWLVLAYIVKIIDWFSFFPYAFISIEKGSWILIAGYYIVLIWLVKRWKRREKFLILNQ